MRDITGSLILGDYNAKEKTLYLLVRIGSDLRSISTLWHIHTKKKPREKRGQVVNREWGIMSPNGNR